MPHLTIEYSANLRATGDLDGLCAALARTLVAFEADGRRVYPVGGVRVRAHAADHWCIGDGRADAAFVHARLSVGAGRGEATLRATGDALFAVIKAASRRRERKRRKCTLQPGGLLRPRITTIS